MPDDHEVDATVLWPHLTLSDVEALRAADPSTLPVEVTIACPRCGAQAFQTTDRRIVYCPWSCQRALPGPASETLLRQLRERHRRRRRSS